MGLSLIVTTVAKKDRSKSPKGRPRRKRKATSESHADRKPFPLNTLQIVLLFFGLTLVLFYRILSPEVMVMATDQITAGIFFKEFQARILRSLHLFPLWDPMIFSGIPFIDAMHGDIFYLTALARLLLPTHVVLNYTFIFHTFLAGLTAFALFRYLGSRKEWAFLLALAYMFSANAISLTYPGHDGKLVIIALFPLFFLLTYKGFREGRLWPFMANGLVLGYMTLSLHLQMLYYVYFVLGLLWAFLVLPEFRSNPKRSFRISVYFGLMVLLALGMSMLRFIPAYYYLSKFSPRAGTGRGYEFATSWALPWEDFISAFVPGFSGFLSKYWGHNPFKINSEYVGFVTLMVGWLGLLWSRRDRLFYFLVTTLVIFTFIVLAGHTPVFKLFYAILPGFKRFRAHSMAFFVINLSLLILGVRGLVALFQHPQESVTSRKFAYLWLLPIAIFVLFGLLQGPITGLLSRGLPPEKVQLLQQASGQIFLGALRVSLLGLVLVWILRTLLKGTFQIFPAITLLAALTLFDLWSVDFQFIQTVPKPSKYYPPDEAVQFLRKDSTVYRVFPMFYRIDNNYLMLYNIESIGGHHGNQFGRYQDFLGASNTIMFRPQSVRNLYQYPKFVDLLNVKYILTQPIPKDYSSFDPATRAFLQEIWNLLGRSGMKLVYQSKTLQIYQNQNALPRAFMVYDYKVIPDSVQVLAWMKSDEFDPRRTVVLEEDPNLSLPPIGDSLPTAKVEILSRNPNRIRLHVVTSQPGFLVYSANFYPYYRATVDGKPARVFRADYILRAVYVNKGTHEVVFYYDPALQKKGGLLTLGSALVLLLGLLWDIRKKHGPQEPSSKESDGEKPSPYSPEEPWSEKDLPSEESPPPRA